MDGLSAYIRRSGNVDRDLTQIPAVFIEYLNSMVSAIRYVDVVLRIDGNAMRRVELSWLAPRLAP